MAISTPKDANRKPTIMATLNTDGITPVSLAVTPSTHRLKCVDGTTGSSITTLNIQLDANRNPVIWGVSSADGTTPTSIYSDSTGSLLVKST